LNIQEDNSTLSQDFKAAYQETKYARPEFRSDGERKKRKETVYDKLFPKLSAIDRDRLKFIISGCKGRLSVRKDLPLFQKIDWQRARTIKETTFKEVCLVFT
jgi:hypothetical protein